MPRGRRSVGSWVGPGPPRIWDSLGKIFKEETSNSRASLISSERALLTSSEKWKILLISGGAILLLALIAIIVFLLVTIQARDTKLNMDPCTHYNLLTVDKKKNNCNGAKFIKPGDWYQFSGTAGTHLPMEPLTVGARDFCGKNF